MNAIDIICHNIETSNTNKSVFVNSQQILNFHVRLNLCLVMYLQICFYCDMCTKKSTKLLPIKLNVFLLIQDFRKHW